MARAGLVGVLALGGLVAVRAVRAVRAVGRVVDVLGVARAAVVGAGRCATSASIISSSPRPWTAEIG